MAQALDDIDRMKRKHMRAGQNLLESLCDRVTGDVMIDPVMCNDKWTYCRFSAFEIVDSECPMPGARHGKFEILGALPEQTPPPPPPPARSNDMQATLGAYHFAIEHCVESSCITTVPALCTA